VISTGTGNPVNTVSVGSQISGIIQKIFTDFNRPVRKNQTIALIDASVYAAQVEQARAKLLLAETQLKENESAVAVADAGLKSAEASLFSAKATFNQAASQYERSKNLATNKVLSQAELEAAKTNLDVSQGALDVATSKVSSARAQLHQAIAQVKGAEATVTDRKAALDLEIIKLNYCTIVSPIDGIVIHRNVDVGQTVAATLQSPTLVTIAEDLSRMQLEVDVSESDVGLIRQGQLVEFTVDAFPDDTFRAVVQQIRNTPTSVQNVVTYKIVASVDNTSLKLRPGMTANVSIEIAKVEGVLKVPNAALRFKPAEATAESGSPAETPAQDRNRWQQQLVEQLQLDETQKATLADILSTERAQLQAQAQATDDPAKRREAARGILERVIKRLTPVLTPAQTEKLQQMMARWQQARSGRSGQEKPGTLYRVDENGQPQAVRILTGISNETETQILTRDFQVGDPVIIGLGNPSTTEAPKTTTNPFLPSRRPGR